MASPGTSDGERLYGSIEGEFLIHTFGAAQPQGLTPFRVHVTQNRIIGVTIPSIVKTVNPDVSLDDVITAPKYVERPIKDLTRVYIVQGKAGKEYSNYTEATYRQVRDFSRYAFVFFSAINRYLCIVIPESEVFATEEFIRVTPLAQKMMLMGKKK